MEKLSKKHSNGNGTGSTFTKYDDVFGGPPKSTLSPRVEDYTEIFRAFHGSSIPVLDIPPALDEETEKVFFDVRSFDYSEVFGGFDGLDFAVCYEDLFCQSNGRDDISSDEAWTPAETECLSEVSEPSPHSAQSKSLSNGFSEQSIDDLRQFNMSYHRASRSEEDISIGLHVSQLHAVPGYTFVVDDDTHQKTGFENTSSQATVDTNLSNDASKGIRMEKNLRKTMSHPQDNSSAIHELETDNRPQSGIVQNGSRSNGMFVSVSEISLRTYPSDLPPPSRPPPPVLDVKNGYSSELASNLRNTKNRNDDLGTTSDESLPPFFDVEVDTGSSAAVSAAAMKEAMEKAQAKLKSAKEIMERKKEGLGLPNWMKPGPKDAVKDKEEKTSRALEGLNNMNMEKVQVTPKVEDGNIEFFAREGRKKVKKTANVVSDSVEGKKFFFVPEETSAEKHAQESWSMEEPYPTDGAGEWKEATEFFELVRTDKSCNVHERENREKFLARDVKLQEHNLEKRAASEACKQQEDSSKKTKTAREAHVADGQKKLKETKETSGQIAHEKKGNEAQEACKQNEKEKKFRTAYKHKEIQKKLSQVDEWNEHDILIEVLENEHELEVLRQVENEKRHKRISERGEYEKGANKYVEVPENDTVLMHALEKERYEKRVKVAFEQAEMEKIQKAAHEKEENKKWLKEAHEQREIEKKQKMAHERENQTKETHEKAEIENKSRATHEKEENERRMKEASEQAEIEKKQKAAREREKNERLMKEAREQAEIVKKQKVAREREEKERQMKEAREQAEIEKKQKAAHEREENERRMREAQLAEIEKKQKVPREKEENEKWLKESREQAEIEKKRKAAQEKNETRLKETHEREEKEKCLKEVPDEKEIEKRSKGAFDQVEYEKRSTEAVEKGEIEITQKEAKEKDQYEKRIREASERKEAGKRLIEALEYEENMIGLKEAHEKEEREKKLKNMVEHEKIQEGSKEGLECNKNEKLTDASEEEEPKELQKGHEDNPRNETRSKQNLSQETCVDAEAENLNPSDEVSELDVEKKVQAAQTTSKGDSKNLGETQEFSADKEGIKVETELTSDKNEVDLVKRENAEATDIFEAPGTPERGSQCEEFLIRKESANKANLSNENGTKTGDAAFGTQKNVKASKMASDYEDVEETVNNVVGQLPTDSRGTVKNIEQPQIFFDPEMCSNVTKPFKTVNGEVEKGRKIELRQSSDGSGQAQKTGQPVKTNQSSQRREQNMNETLGSEQRKQEEKLKKERELEKERLRKMEEEREREREREKDRMAVERATREVRERAYADARERAERAAMERVTAEARQRALAEARERLEKACAEAREKSVTDKQSMDARIRAERAAVDRATTEARERAFEKAMDEKTFSESRGRVERSAPSSGSSYSHSSIFGASYSAKNSEVAEGESAQRCKARLERHRRTAERAAKALAEKNMRDLLAQREQAEKNRLAESLGADVKRWSSGKEGNLRALLSTLQYILGPESGWQPIPLTDVITSAAVKKAYRKATLCVHPDKLQQRGASIQQKYICEKVFDLLKDAWNKFNSEER